MLKKLTLIAGFGAGYVLGAKAGKERYTQIEAKFREVAGMPAVQSATATVKDTASGLADTAKTTVNEKVTAVTDKTSSTSKGSDPVIDLASTPTGASTTTTPAAGAAPSRTAPVV